MIVKGLNKSYLRQTEMTIEEIAEQIYDYINESVKTINILSAGWDAMFGDYAVIKTAKNRLWIVSKGEVFPNNGWIKERGL